MAQSEPPAAEPIDPKRAKKILRTRLDELRGREAELKKPPERGSSISFGKRIGDGTTEAIGRITEVGVADRLDKIEERIVRALEKIEEGTYGICDVCGEEIPAGRLKFAPESTLCVRDSEAARPKV
jgi:RNA polymerase-binding transcription factor